jgi:hypothetical protein
MNMSGGEGRKTGEISRGPIMPGFEIITEFGNLS